MPTMQEEYPRAMFECKGCGQKFITIKQCARHYEDWESDEHRYFQRVQWRPW